MRDILKRKTQAGAGLKRHFRETIVGASNRVVGLFLPTGQEAANEGPFPNCKELSMTSTSTDLKQLNYAGSSRSKQQLTAKYSLSLRRRLGAPIL